MESKTQNTAALSRPDGDETSSFNPTSGIHHDCTLHSNHSQPEKLFDSLTIPEKDQPRRSSSKKGPVSLTDEDCRHYEASTTLSEIHHTNHARTDPCAIPAGIEKPIPSQPTQVKIKREFAEDDDIYIDIEDILDHVETSKCNSPTVNAKQSSKTSEHRQQRKRRCTASRTTESRVVTNRTDGSPVEIKVSIPLPSVSCLCCNQPSRSVTALLEIQFTHPTDKVDRILDRYKTRFLVQLVDGSTSWRLHHELDSELVQSFEASYDGLDLGVDIVGLRWKGERIQHLVSWRVDCANTEDVWVDESRISSRRRQEVAENMSWDDWQTDCE